MNRRELVMAGMMMPSSPTGLTLKPLHQLIGRRYATYWKYS